MQTTQASVVPLASQVPIRIRWQIKIRIWWIRGYSMKLMREYPLTTHSRQRQLHHLIPIKPPYSAPKTKTKSLASPAIPQLLPGSSLKGGLHQRRWVLGRGRMVDPLGRIWWQDRSMLDLSQVIKFILIWGDPKLIMKVSTLKTLDVLI